MSELEEIPVEPDRISGRAINYVLASTLVVIAICACAIVVVLGGAHGGGRTAIVEIRELPPPASPFAGPTPLELEQRARRAARQLAVGRPRARHRARAGRDRDRSLRRRQEQAMTWLIVLVFAGGASDARLSVGLDEHVGARVPMQLAFTDSTGRRVALGDYFDGHRPVVLVMAYARCQMLCSVVLHGVAEAIAHGRGEPGVDYLPLVVSLDPRETPDTALHRQDKLLAEIGHAGDRARWPYLVGDQPDVAALADALGFRYAWDAETQQYAHPAVVFVLAPDGRIAEYVRGVTFDDLPDAVDRARAGALTPSAARDILSCFHFDPATRRYGRQVQLFLQLGSATVVIGLVLIVLVVRRRR